MLLILCGYTAAGKDTYQNWLLDNNKKLKRAVSYTTRPIRPGEKNGREYFFINNEKYEKLERDNKILSGRTYHTYENGKSAIWHYGLPKSAVRENHNYITILDHEGSKRVVKKLGKDKAKVVYLESDDNILYSRSMKRDDEFKEFERRLRDDKEKFKGIEETADLIIKSNGSLSMHSENLKKIESLMEVY